MFGWFSAFGAAQRPRASSVATRWLAVAPQALAQGLAQLGCVLYLPTRRCDADSGDLPLGLLAESMELTPLLRTRYVGLASAVTEEGPREWIECVDGVGALQARIYLLPDTDYLAWDALFADGVAVTAPMRHRAGPPVCFAERARLLCFTRRQVSRLAMLGSEAPSHVSSLGRGVARDIAVAEAVSMAG
ncbi:MAG TPA: hypothetical protein VGO76_16350 [Luteibacter sp.]|jgi:hypothetical protein|nr:hypothetical protein [Luteibacter sp.]